MNRSRRASVKRADVGTYGFHYDQDGVGHWQPAVNVKSYPELTDELLARVSADQGAGSDPRFTVEWIDAHLTDDSRMDYEGFAAEILWEQLDQDAKEHIWPE